MRFIKLKDVMHTTGLSRSTIYRYIAEGAFPKQVSLGARNAVWLESEVHDWMMERIEERDVS